MGMTFLVLALFISLLFGSWLLQAIFLRWGLRWAGIPAVSNLKLFLIVVLLGVASIALTLAFQALSPTSPQFQLLAAVAELLSQIVAACIILAMSLKVRLLRAFKAWLPTLVPSVAAIAFLLLVFRPYVYEAFVAPTNSMAPTIIGHHLTGVCPRCGQPAYGSVPPPHASMPKDGELMICESDLKTCHPTEIAKEVGSPDRFLVNKMISPRRWDVITFRLPSEPSVQYVKRLVGLPGEELLIRDGAVWINGQKLDLPESLRGLEYLAVLDWGGTMGQGAGSTPIKLGADEYFVLGDFSAQASDSRFWETGAPGHPPHAVPKSHIVGVVTHIYWPLSRCRILR